VYENAGWRAPSSEERATALSEYRDELFPDLDPIYTMVDYELPSPPHGLHAFITEAGKAEWRQRHPLAREDAWECEGHPSLGAMTIWAIDEEVADAVAGPPPYASREVEAETFRLRRGETIDGVKVTYRWA
jgi:hypothetical protein